MPRPFYLVYLLLVAGSWYLVSGTLHLGHVCQDLVTYVRSTLYLVYLVSIIGSWYLALGTLERHVCQDLVTDVRGTLYLA